jgi:integrase
MERREISPPTEQQVHQMFRAAKGTRWEAVWITDVGMGLRRGELLGLRWQDIDFDNLSFKVVQQIQRITAQPLGAVPLKTKQSRRNLRMPEQVAKALRTHRTRQLEQRLAAGPAWHDNDLIFANTIGKPQEPRAVNTAFKRLLRKSCLPVFTIYATPVQRCLRNTAPTCTTSRSGLATTRLPPPQTFTDT